jgi:hypothetical protein
MTNLPDWLVERAALDEVGAASRERLDRADATELAARVAALREANIAELAAHPPGPALAEIIARVAAAKRRRRRRQLSLLGIAASAAAIVLVARFAVGDRKVADDTHGEVTRVKGTARLAAFRQAGDQVERLDQDAIVHAGDVIQLRYNAGGHGYGVIASLDGAGGITLHFPATADAATAVAPETTTLPTAFALDEAPKFERFFFVTANEPIDVERVLDSIRNLSRRDDAATSALELPTGLRQWTLRLRKP